MARPVSLEHIPANDLIADVAIVGSGPAGLFLAHSLRVTGLRVLLIETGSEGAATPDVRALSPGTNEHRFSPAASEGNRIRQLGGNANAWGLQRRDGTTGVRMVELDDIDFQSRPATGAQSWPFSKSHLQPWYDRAADLLGMRHFGAFPDDAGIQTERLTTRFAQIPPVTSVLHDPLAEIVAAPSVTIVTDATMLGAAVEEGPSPRVASIEIGSLRGARRTVRAGVFVLACGGFENPRQLLLMPRVAGTGLASDCLGRYLMEHPMDSSDFLESVPVRRDSSAFAADLDMQSGGPADHIGYVTLRPEVLLSEDSYGMSTWLFPRPHRWDPLEGEFAIRFLAGRGVPPTYPARLVGRSAKLRAAGRLVARPGGALYWTTKGKIGGRPIDVHINQGGWPAAGKDRFRFYNLTRIIEQGPSRANQVTLSHDRDAFGLPRTHVVWTWTPFDIDRTLRTKHIVNTELNRLGIGTVIDRTLDHAVPGAAHVLGTTRMSERPADGTVDPDGRVHGVANLYVAGSSVFTVGGWANPTFTIIALALRMADHLAARGRSSGV